MLRAEIAPVPPPLVVLVVTLWFVTGPLVIAVGDRSQDRANADVPVS